MKKIIIAYIKFLTYLIFRRLTQIQPHKSAAVFIASSINKSIVTCLEI